MTNVLCVGHEKVNLLFSFPFFNSLMATARGGMKKKTAERRLKFKLFLQAVLNYFHSSMNAGQFFYC